MDSANYYAYISFIFWWVLPKALLLALIGVLFYAALRRFPRWSVPVVVLGFAGFFLFALFSYQAYELAGSGSADGYEAGRASERIAAAQRLSQQDQERLSGTGWADAAAGTVTVPIKDAMKLQVAALAKDNKIRPANAIQPVTPAPAPAPAPAAEAPAEESAAPAAGTAPATEAAPAEASPEKPADAAKPAEDSQPAEGGDSMNGDSAPMMEGGA